MDIHNNSEDTVLAFVHDICDAIEKEGRADRPCTCYQCRLDTACYVLNRTAPRYVVSSRGAARVESESLERQQEGADIASLVYEGISKVAQFLRPQFTHNSSHREPPVSIPGPVFNIPTIIGRVFNGSNFEPMRDIEVELHYDHILTEMIDPNWQNPYKLVPNTAGTFTFWPKPVKATSVGETKSFEFSVHIAAEGFEVLQHFFEVQIVSQEHVTSSFSVERTFKLPDLYLFSPGGEEDE